jgi:hypothetical protein
VEKEASGWTIKESPYFYPAIFAASAIAGYGLYKLFSKSKRLGQEEFYDGSEGHKWLSVINRTDKYTGLGVYPT